MTLVVDHRHERGVVRVSRWIFNTYVLLDAAGTGAVVVDAGLPSSARDLAPILRGLTVHAIVATHGHSDHLAGAPELSQHTGAPVVVSPTTASYVGAPTVPPSPDLGAVMRIAPVFVDQPFDLTGSRGFVSGAKVAGFGTGKPMRWTGPAPQPGLVDGSTLPGLPDWTVLATPGHTDDSAVFWNATTRTLVSGDTVLGRRGQAWATPEVVDPIAAGRSFETLRALDPTMVLPGHGLPAGFGWR